MSAGTLVATSITGGTMNLATGITVPSLLATTSVSSGAVNATNIVGTSITTSSINMSTGSIRGIGIGYTLGNLYYNTQGVLGVGITNPGVQLDVSGVIRTSSLLTAQNVTANVSGTIPSLLSTNVTITNGGLNATFNSNTIGNIITTGGNVGIGTISPAFTLDITGTLRATTSITSASINATNVIGTSITGSNITGTTVSAGTLLYTTAIGSNQTLGALLVTGGGLAATFNSNTLGNIFTTGGNVGIGTTSPGSTSQIDIYNTGTTTYPNYINALYPNLPAGGGLNLTFGVANSAYNLAQIGFGYVSSGNTSNNIAFSVSGRGICNMSWPAGIVPANDNTIGLGSSSFRFNNIYGYSVNAISNSNTLGNIFTTGGNVGIGTSAPGFTLDVVGTGRFTTSVSTASVNATNITGTSITGSNVIGTTVSAGTLVASSITGGTMNLATGITVPSLLATTSVSSGAVNATNIVSTSITGNNLIGTTVSAGTLVATSITGGTMNLATGITVPSLLATTSVSSASVNASNIVGTSITGSNMVISNVTSGSVNATTGTFSTLGTGWLAASTVTAANINVSGNVNVAGTLNVVNITTTNLIDTNITAVSVVASSVTTGTILATTSVSTASVNATNIVGTTVSSGTLSATTITGSNAQISGTVSAGTLQANTTSVTGTLSATTITGSNAQISGTVSAGTLQANTTSVTGTLSATTITGSNAQISGTVSAGTLAATAITTSNINSTNLTTNSLIVNGVNRLLNTTAVAVTANNYSLTSGALNISGDTVISGSNEIVFTTTGASPPGLNGRSSGTKIVLYPQTGVTQGDFAIGIEPGNTWFQVPSSVQGYKFYQGTSASLVISGAGNVNVAGGLTSGNINLSGDTVTYENSGNSQVFVNIADNQALRFGSNQAYKTHMLVVGETFSNGGRVAARFSNYASWESVNGTNTAGTTIRMIVVSSGNVGIGTTTPSFTLDVSGGARFTSNITTGSLFTTNITSTNIVGSAISAGSINVTTGNMDSIITNTFSAGTSISTPLISYTGTSLNIQSLGSSGRFAFITNTSGNYNNQIQLYMLGLPNASNQSVLNIGSTAGLMYTIAPGASGSGKNYPLALGYGNLLTLATNGNAGINTTSPQYTLDVNGTLAGTTISVGSINVSGNVNVAGTLNVVNITTTNIIDTNITAGTLLLGSTMNMSGVSTQFAGTFSGNNNVSSPAAITGLIFPSANSRSFTVTISINLNKSGGNLNSQVTLEGIQGDSGWNMFDSLVGDNTGVVFSINSSGQILYTSPNSVGFVSLNIRYDARLQTITGTYLPTLPTTGNTAVSGQLSVGDATDAANTSSASLTVSGGAGIAKNLLVGGNVNVGGMSNTFTGSFAAANNVASATNVTGFLVPTATFASFTAVVNARVVTSTTTLNAQYYFEAAQTSTGWILDDTQLGDTLNITFTITSTGQIQYTHGNYSNWLSTTFNYTATAISISSGFTAVLPTSGNVSIAGNLSISNTTDANTTSTASLVLSGGLGVAKGLLIGGNFNVGGVTTQFAGTFAAANNVSGASVTGLLFPNATIRSFTTVIGVNVVRSAGGNLFSQVTIEGVQTASGWVINDYLVGDDSGITFSINSSGQILYTSPNFANWLSTSINFTANAVNISGSYSPIPLATSGTATISGPLTIQNSSDASSLSSGGLSVAGGVSIGRNLLVAGGFQVNGGTLYVNNTTNSIGINTTNPGYTLDVSGTANVIGGLSSTFNSNTIGSLVTTGGNVGIGNNSPGQRLIVAGAPIGNAVEIQIGNSSYTSANIRMGVPSASGVIITNAILGSGVITNDYGPLQFGSGTGGVSTARMIIGSTGNVGIGTTSPTTALQVVGDIYSSGVLGGSNISMYYKNSPTQGSTSNYTIAVTAGSYITANNTFKEGTAVTKNVNNYNFNFLKTGSYLAHISLSIGAVSSNNWFGLNSTVVSGSANVISTSSNTVSVLYVGNGQVGVTNAMFMITVSSAPAVINFSIMPNAGQSNVVQEYGYGTGATHSLAFTYLGL